MVTLNAKFCEFIEPASVCSALASVSIAAEMLHQQGCDRIVIVDESQYPVGLIHLRQLLPLLGDPAYAHQSLSTLLQSDSLPAVVQDHLLSDYAVELKYSSVRFWAVTDCDRTYLGIVDVFYLRKFLVLATSDRQDDHLGTDPGAISATRNFKENASQAS